MIQLLMIRIALDHKLMCNQFIIIIGLPIIFGKGQVVKLLNFYKCA